VGALFRGARGFQSGGWGCEGWLLAGVFVPPKGRAYGDVKRAFNSCERLVLLSNDSFEKRDYGVLLYHMKRNTEAYEVLKEFKENYDPNTVQIPIAGFESGPVATDYETQLLDDILKQLEVKDMRWFTLPRLFAPKGCPLPNARLRLS
jgi:hypothetical protein